MAEEPQKRFETFTDDFGNEWYDREQVDTEIERLTAALRDLRYRSPLTALDVERICEQALRRSWDYPRSSPDETTCDHDYVWREAFRYECDKCGEISRDGVAEETSTATTEKNDG